MFSKRFFVIVFVFVFVFIFVFLPSLWSKVSRIALWWCSQNVFVFNVVFIFVMGSYLSFCWSNLSKCLKKSQTSRMKQDVLYLHGILFIQIKVQDKIRYLGHDGSQPDYIYDDNGHNIEDVNLCRNGCCGNCQLFVGPPWTHWGETGGAMICCSQWSDNCDDELQVWRVLAELSPEEQVKLIDFT